MASTGRYPRIPRRWRRSTTRPPIGKLKAVMTPHTPRGCHCSYMRLARTLGVHRPTGKILRPPAALESSSADAREAPFGTRPPEPWQRPSSSGWPAAPSTGRMNRYPRRGSVSMKRGLRAESPRAARKRFSAAPSPWSKSTKVSSLQRAFRACSRVTTSPGCSRSKSKSWMGCSWSLIRRPCFRSSPAPGSTSKSPKRTGLDDLDVGMACPLFRAVGIIVLAQSFSQRSWPLAHPNAVDSIF